MADLDTYLSLGTVGVPDQYPVVFAAAEEEVAVGLAPGHRQDASLVGLQGLEGTGGQPQVPDLD